MNNKKTHIILASLAPLLITSVLSIYPASRLIAGKTISLHNMLFWPVVTEVLNVNVLTWVCFLAISFTAGLMLYCRQSNAVTWWPGLTLIYSPWLFIGLFFMFGEYKGP